MANKLNLRAKLEQLAVISFIITNITSTKDREGNYIATLEIESPISKVTGSQTVELSGKRVPIEAFDVETIKVHEQDMDVEGFEIDEEGTTGVYTGKDLILDVAKSGDVWLRKETFATSGNEMRRNNREGRTQSIIEKVVARREAAGVAAPKGALEPTNVGG